MQRASRLGYSVRRRNINNIYDHRFSAIKVLTPEACERRAVALHTEHHAPLMGYAQERTAGPLTVTVHPSYVAQYARRKAVTA